MSRRPQTVALSVKLAVSPWIGDIAIGTLRRHTQLKSSLLFIIVLIHFYLIRNSRYPWFEHFAIYIVHVLHAHAHTNTYTHLSRHRHRHRHRHTHRYRYRHKDIHRHSHRHRHRHTQTQTQIYTHRHRHRHRHRLQTKIHVQYCLYTHAHIQACKALTLVQASP